MRSTMKPRSSIARHSRVTVPKWIAVLALFVALLPDSTLASMSVCCDCHCIYFGIERFVVKKWRSSVVL